MTTLQAEIKNFKSEVENSIPTNPTHKRQKQEILNGFDLLDEYLLAPLVADYLDDKKLAAKIAVNMCILWDKGHDNIKVFELIEKNYKIKLTV